MNFTKGNAQTTKGRQPSKYDALLPNFTEPGDYLAFEESEISRQTASNIAKRLMTLAPTKKFHSYYDVLEKKVIVRLRMDGEVVEKEEDEEQKEEQKEPETYEQMVEREKQSAKVEGDIL